MAERLCIVTGHSRGLGAALAAALLKPGHRVIGISRRTNDSLAQAAATNGARLEQWTADLAEPLPVAQRLRATL